MKLVFVIKNKKAPGIDRFLIYKRMAYPCRAVAPARCGPRRLLEEERGGKRTVNARKRTVSAHIAFRWCPIGANPPMHINDSRTSAQLNTTTGVGSCTRARRRCCPRCSSPSSKVDVGPDEPALLGSSNLVRNLLRELNCRLVPPASRTKPNATRASPSH